MMYLNCVYVPTIYIVFFVVVHSNVQKMLQVFIMINGAALLYSISFFLERTPFHEYYLCLHFLVGFF